MLSKILVLIIAVSYLANAAYQPEMMLAVTSDLINKEIIKYGANISKAVNDFKIPDINNQTKTSGVTIKYHLTNIKQQVAINWKSNILQVKDIHSFMVHSKNVGITLHAQLQVKIGLTRKQKGTLVVNITGLEVDTTIRFTGNKCQKSIGFDVQIDDVFVNTNSISVKIEGKAFDNLVIAQAQRLIIPRVPSLLNKALSTQINPLISDKTCTRIERQILLNKNTSAYILILNTTKVPDFDDNLKHLRVPIDITFQNLLTNQTNDEVQRDDLPQNLVFERQSDASLSLSSNFLNTVMWLIDDSKLLYQVVTNSMLGDNPPIALNTTNLSILMPKLKDQWPNKQVFLIISPSTKYEHLLIRSGRIVTVISLSVKFAVNITGKALSPDQCLKSGDCVVACNLNMTLPVSLALKLGSKLAMGLLHHAAFYDIEIIESKIDINLKTLKAIINEIVGSMLPDLNEQLATGIELPDKIWEMLAKFDVSDVMSKTFLDFIALGLKFDL